MAQTEEPKPLQLSRQSSSESRLLIVWEILYRCFFPQIYLCQRNRNNVPCWQYDLNLGAM